MNPVEQSTAALVPRRRFVVHLLGVRIRGSEQRRYTVRIRPWIARVANQPEHERVFADENELIATINPLLPPGSDVRDIFTHIENVDGFLYMLNLSDEEAARLGWRGSIA